MALNIAGLVSMIIFYLVIMAVGIIAAKLKQRRDKNRQLQGTAADELMVGNRNIGVFTGAFSIAATSIGGGFINGVAESIYTSGLVNTMAIWCYSLSLVLGTVLTARQMRERGFTTMLDVFTCKYGSRWTTVFFLPELFGDLFWAAAILAALGATMAVILHIDSTVTILISAGVAILYTLLGGFYSVSYTDIVQAFFIFFGLWLTVPFVYTSEAVSNISETSAHWLGTFSIRNLGQYIDATLMMCFGGFPWQAYYQRVLAMKRASDARLAAFLATGIIVLCTAPPFLLGAAAVSTDWNSTDYGPLNPGDESFVLPLSLQYLTPTAVSIIGLGTVAAAVMSSADSCVLAVASVFSRNIYQAVIRPKASDREVVWVMRVSIVLFGGLATVIALVTDTIYGLFVLCADLMYVIMFPQLMLALYFRRSNTYGMLLSYAIALLLRVLAGEPVLSFQPVLHYPYYDELLGQLFPFRTFAMLVGALTHMFVSTLTHWLFSSGQLDKKYDILNCYQERTQSIDQKHSVATTKETEMEKFL